MNWTSARYFDAVGGTLSGACDAFSADQGKQDVVIFRFLDTKVSARALKTFIISCDEEHSALAALGEALGDAPLFNGSVRLGKDLAVLRLDGGVEMPVPLQIDGLGAFYARVYEKLLGTLGQ